MQALLDGTHRAQQRLALEELTAHHLSLLRLRQRVQSQRAVPLPATATLEQQLLAGLPFQPTAAQQRVHREISGDLCRDDSLQGLRFYPNKFKSLPSPPRRAR